MEGQFGSRAPNSPEPQKAADFPEAPFNQTVSPWLHRPEIAGMETQRASLQINGTHSQELGVENPSD